MYIVVLDNVYILGTFETIDNAEIYIRHFHLHFPYIKGKKFSLFYSEIDSGIITHVRDVPMIIITNYIACVNGSPRLCSKSKDDILDFMFTHSNAKIYYVVESGEIFPM